MAPRNGANGLHKSSSLVSIGGSRLHAMAAGLDEESLFNFGESIASNTSLSASPSRPSITSKLPGHRQQPRSQTARDRLQNGTQGHVFAQSRCCVRPVIAPEVDLPQRLSMPVRINVPKRSAVPTRDARIRSLFSSRAPSRQTQTHNMRSVSEKVETTESIPEGSNKPRESIGGLQRSKYDIGSYGAGGGGNGKNTNHVTNTRLKHSGVVSVPSSHNSGAVQSRLRDYSVLASACRRGGLTEQEGQAYLSKAILHDNMNNWRQAIEQYLKYLEICEYLKDHEGKILALSSIGVDLFALAQDNTGNEGSAVDLFREGADMTVLERSAFYHEQHLALSTGMSRFVALTNLGLVVSALGDNERAADLHQEALSLGVKLQDPHAQSVAVGNLAVIGKRQGDLQTAKACLGKHLTMARDLGDGTAESLACHQLGSIANREGDYQKANAYYEEARRLATSNGEVGMLKLVNCDLGITHGNMRLSQYIESITTAAAQGHH